MNLVILTLIVFGLKVLNVLDVILQKFGIKLLRVTKERVLNGKLRTPCRNFTNFGIKQANYKIFDIILNIGFYEDFF